VKIHICAVGRLKAGPEKELFEEYLTRARGLGKKLGISRIESAEAPESIHEHLQTRIRVEAAGLHKIVPRSAHTVALDAAGKQWTSEALARFVQKHLDEGMADFAFLIGGPDGHAKETLATANGILSLGLMTWPHRLVRIMLAEQIYRAVTILTNHPYHRP
jgi:23S rRNA (pseudouridine1915-N3)-methyltransferase